MIYKDRKDAGEQLAEKLKKYAGENTIIMALPRGGVVLGYEVAKTLKAPLDVIVPRKIGAPHNPEFGIGAIAPKEVTVLNEEVIEYLNIPKSVVRQIIERETNEMNRRINLSRKNLPDLDLNNKTVISVDDGIATGVSTLAAVLSIKSMNPEKIILAVPVCSPISADKFRQNADEFICLNEIPDFTQLALITIISIR